MVKDKLKLAIVGYGRLGKAVEQALRRDYPNYELEIITRRPIDVTKHTSLQVIDYQDVIQNPKKYEDRYKGYILCSGAADLLTQGPFFAKLGKNIVILDSFDNHANVVSYFESIHNPAIENRNTYIYGLGWHPGLLSLMDSLQRTLFPGATTCVAYGSNPSGGLSMGHGEEVRKKVEGVVDARQYTHMNLEIIERIRSGEKVGDVLPRDKIWREVFVVAEENADLNKIEQDIKTMPGYYAPYDTIVIFVSQEELDKIDKERGMCHDGIVLTVGHTGLGNQASIETKVVMKNNAEFTAYIIIAYLRAAMSLNQSGQEELNELNKLTGDKTRFEEKIRNRCFGAKTVFNIPAELLAQESPMELIRTRL